MSIARKYNAMSYIPSREFKDGNVLEAKKSNILLQLSFPYPPESVMEIVQDTCKGSIACDIILAWVSIADGVTEKTASTREKYWRHWDN